MTREELAREYLDTIEATRRALDLEPRDDSWLVKRIRGLTLDTLEHLLETQEEILIAVRRER